jgi:hypothetical protein
MDKLAGLLMMLVGVALGMFSIPPASWMAMIALVAGGMLFVGGIHVIQHPSSREGS